MKLLKRALCSAMLILAGGALGTRADAGQAAPPEVSLKIDAPSMVQALNEFAQQTGLQLIFPAEEVTQGLAAPRLAGTFTPEAALGQLLANSGLYYQFINANTVAIRASRKISDAAAKGSDAAGDVQLRLARAAAGNEDESASTSRAQSDEQTPGEGGNDSEAGSPDEIIVTAQKRSERLLDVPVAIGVMSGERLEANDVKSLSDLANYVPGLSIQDGGAPGARTIVIRGLSTGYSPTSGAPLASTYIDDSPVGATSGVRGAEFGIDLMTYDLDRIEVLRGPQGTLYGSGAMAGIVKYVLRKPDLNQFEARFGADTQSIASSDSLGWSGRAAVNMPLIAGTLGLRVSGVHRDNAGYADNVGLGIDNSNSSTQSAGRVALLWRPSERFSLQANLMMQDTDSRDRAGVTLDSVTREPFYDRYSRATNFLEPFKQKTTFASLAINADFGWATLVSASSWSKLNSNFITELPAYGVFTPGHPDALAYSRVIDEVTKYAQEIRLASADTQRLQWMIGGLYTREEPLEDYSLPTFTPDKQPLPTNLFRYVPLDGRFEERAVFGNLTFKLTERLDVSGGLRRAENKDFSCTDGSGLFNPFGVRCTSRPSQGVTTWMGNVRFHPTQDVTLYVRAATGYRPGGGCTGCGIPALSTPDFYYSDEITNYEAGMKGQFLDRRLQLDLSAFYIDWSDVQVTVVSPQNVVYLGNGGTASSKGFELAASFSPVERLQLHAVMAYTDAKLTEDALGVGGRNGDQLPVSPTWSGSLNADYRRELNERATFLLGAGYRYRDRVFSLFPSSPNPAPLKPQNIVDAYTGIARDNVTLRLYARNLLNDDSYAGLLLFAAARPIMVVPIQPRTIGLSVDYQF